VKFRDCDLAFYVRHFHDHGVPSEHGLLLPRHPLWRPRLKRTLHALAKVEPHEEARFSAAFEEAFEEVMAPYRVPVTEWVKHLRAEGLDEAAIRERLRQEGYPKDAEEAGRMDLVLREL